MRVQVLITAGNALVGLVGALACAAVINLTRTAHDVAQGLFALDAFLQFENRIDDRVRSRRTSGQAVVSLTGGG